ncbi:MAG TPA: hypothetical protein VKZ98_01740 [Aquaticitalea sp.]|nr:hypothetical protein [Aquaticitalea sp.]
MAYYDLDKISPPDNGMYIVQVLSLKGYIREAKAIWEKQKGFNLVTSALKPDEFIKAWWLY